MGFFHTMLDLEAMILYSPASTGLLQIFTDGC